MRWLVTGAGGMLGHDTVQELRGRGEDVTGLDRAALDITEPAAVRRALAEHRPDVVVNCAAYTAVDDAESDEERALRVNGDGPRLLARACAGQGARLIHVSTDYVFSGEGRTTPYPGERAVLDELPGACVVLRTGWLYGARGRNFVRTMLEVQARRPTVDVVDDQRGQPTWSADVAARIADLGARPAHGVLHATSSGEATWYELAREVFRLTGADPDRVRPTDSRAFVRPAPRPSYSVLGHERWRAAGLAPLRDWRTALHEALPHIRKETT
jgi:dTDP-4-dehydrorhamnose reductase/4-ketoreductase